MRIELVFRKLRVAILKLADFIYITSQIASNLTPLPSTLRAVRRSHGIEISDADGTQISIPTRSRIHLYRRGIKNRLLALASQYCLDSSDFADAQVFVDVGANVGELGILAEQFNVSYFAFEPDPSIYESLRRNVHSAQVFKVALGEKVGQETFYSLPKTADSSVIRPSAKKYKALQQEITSLDHFAKSVNSFPPEIEILKIDAEGYEPEVLRGAIRTLKRCRVVVVDAGVERQGTSTLAEVVNIMIGQGFDLKAFNPDRYTLRFENSSLPH